jgi:hypothetical protein
MNLKLQKVQEQFEERIRIAIEQERIHHTRIGFIKDNTRVIKERYKKWLADNKLEASQEYYVK